MVRLLAVALACLFLVSSAVSRVLNLPEGANCRTLEGEAGKCKSLKNCPSQVLILRANLTAGGYNPVTCMYKGADPIVCCAEEKNAPDRNEDIKDNAVVGRKALDACRRFEREINDTIAPYIIAGEDTYPGEFPHMVALGYRNEDGNGYAWDCGGSLISPNFVLTAAHCLYNTVWGKPDVVRVGVHNLTRDDEGRILRVIGDHVHPDYQAPSHYFDVALLRIPSAKFDEKVGPACLYTKMDTPKRMIVTGWGTFDEDLSRKSDVLLKAYLIPVGMTQCNSSFVGSAFSSRLSRGIAPDMICAQGANGRSDSCGGDSGGPLQSKRNQSMLYNVVGVTSFGALCGGIGVYDRVASFVDWIERIVWAD